MYIKEIAIVSFLCLSTEFWENIRETEEERINMFTRLWDSERHKYADNDPKSKAEA